MRISQRVARSEIHFFMQKLYNKGYHKISMSHHDGGYRVKLQRTSKKSNEILTIKFSANGWVSMS